MTLTMPAAEQFIEKIGASRWTPVSVNVVAMLLLTYSLAQWSWRLMEPTPALNNQRPIAPIADSATELRQLLSANLFGQADVAAGQNLSPSSIPPDQSQSGADRRYGRRHQQLRLHQHQRQQ